MHVPQVPESSRIRFRTRSHTRWSDEDNQNVVNNAVYMTLKIGVITDGMLPVATLPKTSFAPGNLACRAWRRFSKST